MRLRSDTDPYWLKTDYPQKCNEADCDKPSEYTYHWFLSDVTGESNDYCREHAIEHGLELDED